MLWQNSNQGGGFDPGTEKPDLPATFGETFDAAWNEGRLFAQSLAGENARMDALQDHIDDLKAKTGRDVNQMLDLSGFDVPGVGFAPPNATALLPQVNEAAKKLGQPELSDDDLEQRAVEKSRAAMGAAAAVAGREQTAGSRFGSFLGGAAAQATDPINIAALPIAPEAESVSILAAALRWGAVAGVAQAGIEATGGAYHEEVQPGYLASGAPFENVAEAFGQGALLGGGTRLLGNAWTRVKTGAWPQSVRDAGNVVESEANIAGSNVYPGAAGEAAHRQALGKAIDDILAERPVEAPVPPEMEAQAGKPDLSFAASQTSITDAAEQGMRRPIVETPMPSGANSSRDLNGPVYVDPRVPEPLRRPVAVHETVEQVLMDRGMPYEQAHQIATQAEKRAVEAAGMDWEKYTHEWDGLLSGIEHEKVSELPPDLHVNPEAAIGHHGSASKQAPIEQARQGAIGAAEQARTAAAPTSEVAPQLPFEATAAQAKAEAANGQLADGVRQIAQKGGYAMPAEDAAAIAKRLTALDPERANAALRELQVNPRAVAEWAKAPVGESPVRAAEPAAGPPVAPLNESTLKSPAMDEAVRADLDRERMTADVKIPVDLDKDGNVIHRSVDAAMNEVDGLKAAAEQIQACAAPRSSTTSKVPSS